MGRLVAVILLMAGLGGCGWPRDSAGTLDEVRGGVLRVGITANAPWTDVADDGSVRGVEVTLVERFAAGLGARIEWYPGSESTLMAALRHRVLDLVVGGLTDDAPWVKEASLTRPYITTSTVVAAPPGVTVPADLDGVRIAARAGTEDIATVLAADAVPVAVQDIAASGDLPVVVDEWEIEPAGLHRSRHALDEQKHVMAVPLGENGFQTTVERFLLGLTRSEVLDLLSEAEGAGR